MEISMHSTTKIVEINGVPARVWKGVTRSGIDCIVYVTRVAVDKALDTKEFEQELQEHAAPTPEIAAIPLRLIL